LEKQKSKRKIFIRGLKRTTILNRFNSTTRYSLIKLRIDA
jgi:hypothetical protein